MGHRGQTGASLGGRVVNTSPSRRRRPITKASEVTVRHADGTTETHDPYSPAEQRRIIARGSARQRGHHR